MDGEGCFYAGHNKNGGGIVLQVCFGTKDEVFMSAVLKALATLGLSPNVTRYTTKNGCSMKAIHIAKAPHVATLTKSLLPFLTLKKPVAGLLSVLASRKIVRSRKQPLRSDFRMVDMVRQLNRRETTLSHTPLAG